MRRGRLKEHAKNFDLKAFKNRLFTQEDITGDTYRNVPPCIKFHMTTSVGVKLSKSHN